MKHAQLFKLNNKHFNFMHLQFLTEGGKAAFAVSTTQDQVRQFIPFNHLYLAGLFLGFFVFDNRQSFMFEKKLPRKY